ncbi:STAS domain-containing protein [Deltaproteobacteria bacterium TL4]
MEIEILSENQIALIRSETPLEKAAQVKEPLEKLKSSGYRYVLLDLLKFDWISSEGIGVILWSFHLLAEEDVQLILLIDAPVLLKTFETININELVSIYPSQKKALQVIEKEKKKKRA